MGASAPAWMMQEPGLPVTHTLGIVPVGGGRPSFPSPWQPSQTNNTAGAGPGAGWQPVQPTLLPSGLAQETGGLELRAREALLLPLPWGWGEGEGEEQGSPGCRKRLQSLTSPWKSPGQTQTPTKPCSTTGVFPASYQPQPCRFLPLPTLPARQSSFHDAPSLLFPRPRARDQLPPHPRSRRYSGDSDSSASSAQSGPLGARSDDSGAGPRRERPSRRLTTGTPASPRRPPAPRSQSRDHLDRGRLQEAPRGRRAQLSTPSPARRARSQSREEQAVLLVRRDRDGQHSWVARGRAGGGSGRSSPHTPRARSPAAPRPPRVSSPGPELGATPASVFRTPLQLDPQHEQQLFRRLEEEFLANARALEATAGGTPTGPAPDPVRAPDAPGPDSAYCSSSSSSSSLCVLGGKCGQPGDSGRVANGLPRCRGPALSSSSDEGSPCPGVGGQPDASGSHLAGPEPPRTWARGRMDTQPDGKPSRIPTPRGPRRPSEPTVPGAWHALHSVSPRVEPDSWM